MELLFVQLTDVHIQDKIDKDILMERVQSIIGAICIHVTEPNTKIVFCITGDCAYSGKKEQYIEFGNFIEKIITEIAERKKDVEIITIFVPGNHDCDFDNSNAKVREALLASPALDIYDKNVIKVCTSIQENFFMFQDEWGKKHKTIGCEDDRIITIKTLNFKETRYRFVFHCINSSWCSTAIEKKGKMRNCLDEIFDKEEDDIVITLLHHDAEWLDWNDKEKWNDYQKRYSDLIFVGHDHMTEIYKQYNFEGARNEFVKGNQLYDKEFPNQSGFNIIKLKFDNDTISECGIVYEWSENVYKKIRLTEYHSFIRNEFVGAGICISSEMREYLNTIDIDVPNPNNNTLRLDDVFAFPTLVESETKEKKFIRDMDTFINYSSKNNCISIQGDKEYGKTSLLKMIFLAYYEMSKYPVLLDANKITSGDGEILNRIFEVEYDNEYTGITGEEIMQKSSSERVCLVDNFEQIQIDDKETKKFLQYLKMQFNNIIISKNHTLELRDSLTYVETNDFVNEEFAILNLQSVRGSYKDRIVSKWIMTMNPHQDINSEGFDAKRKEKYEQIKEVMSINFFNKTPMDLLLVLSYLEEAHPTQLNYGRFSYIYDALILAKLNAISDNQALISSVYELILQKLSFKIYKENGSKSFEEEYILNVIHEYKENYSNIHLKPTEIIRNLVKYNFIEEKTDYYRFKHSYMYYYFVSSYILNELIDNERDEVINDIFEKIHLDENYNVALFLAYNLNIKQKVLPLLKTQISALLSEKSEFQFEELRKIIDDLGLDIEKIVDEIYTVPRNENIPKLRKNKFERQDIEENRDDQLKEGETDEDVKEVNYDVRRLGRYIDFMGNLLKNFSGKLDNGVREDLIGLMFESLQRILGAFCGFYRYFVNKIVELISEKMQENNEDELSKTRLIQEVKQVAVKAYLQYIGMNISYLSYSLECDIITENLRKYVSTHPSEFARMTEVEFLLRLSQLKLPISEISKLFRGKNQLSVVSKKIISDNIYKYLCSYQYERNDKEKLCSLLGFNIREVVIEENKYKALIEK